jgi:hypothetical protein
MTPVNKTQMGIHWQAQIHATTTSLIISSSETSVSKKERTDHLENRLE